MAEHKVENMVMAEIKALRRRQAEITEETQVKTELLRESIEKIRQLILRNQGTSGDRITDYFLAAHGTIDDTEVSKPFREVEGQMAGKKGELFLVVQRKRDRHVFHGCFWSEGPSESDFHLEAHYFLGVLSAEKLYLDAKALRYGLPTEAYGELSGSGWKVLDRNPEGPFCFDYDGFQKLGKTIQAGRDSGLALEIIIGNVAVFSYLPYGHKSMLGHQRWVIAFNKAARLLGKDVPEASEEIAAREEERKEVLKSLDEKRETRNRLLSNAPASSEEMVTVEKNLQLLLERAKELGLEDELLVQLVATEMRALSP